MRERILSTLFSIGLLLIGSLFSHFFWQKETNTSRLNKDIEILKESKLDKTDFNAYKSEHNLQQIRDLEHMQKYFDTRFDDLKEFIKAQNRNR